MQSTELEWSETEQQVARSAFDRAYAREISTIIAVVREQSQMMSCATEVWHLHDLLSSKRHELDGKYDYRYPELILVFARLVKDGWLDIKELEGLEVQKVQKISALSRIL
jgi:hypothetical protein